jgi:transposase
MIWAENWERKNFEKTKVKLAKLHQKIARQRKAFNHRLSTKYVRLFDEIALENTALTNMVRAVKKGTEGVPNGRKAKSGLNRNLLDNAIGQFYTMIEVKAKASHRIVTRVEPQYTSQTCNACGYRAKENRESQAKFVCQHCGHSDNADTNAALNIKKMMQRGIQRLTFTDDMADEWGATTLPKTTKQPNPVEVVDPKPRKRSSHSKPAKPAKAKPDHGGCRKRVAEPLAQLDLFMV